jgi:hypothetical protein
VNDAPVLSAIADTTTEEEVAVELTLAAADVDGDAVTFTAVSSDTVNISTDISGSLLTLTPALNFYGSATITVTVSDNGDPVESDSDNFILTVTSENDAPLAIAQSLTTAEDSGVSILLEGTDDDGDALTYVVVSGPTNGTLTGTAPVLSYSPNTNYNGSDSFTFSATDGTLSDTAVVSIEITPVNDPPMAFSLLNPADNDTIFLGDDDDLLDDLIFSWTESENVDGDTIEYTIFRTDNFLSDSILVGENTQWTIPVQTIFDAMAENQISNYSLTWYVKAYDMELSVPSTQTFTFNIDATEMLSIDNGDLVPKSFSLHQNYPNPFNPVTNIGYDISEKTVVHIEIYDITGKLVNVFNEGLQEPGRYTLNWNASDVSGRRLSGGMYIYRINTEKFSKTRKMILLK